MDDELDFQNYLTKHAAQFADSIWEITHPPPTAIIVLDVGKLKTFVFVHILKQQIAL